MSDKLSKGIGTSVYSSPEQQNQRVYDSKVKSLHLMERFILITANKYSNLAREWSFAPLYPTQQTL